MRSLPGANRLREQKKRQLAGTRKGESERGWKGSSQSCHDAVWGAGGHRPLGGAVDSAAEARAPLKKRASIAEGTRDDRGETEEVKRRVA